MRRIWLVLVVGVAILNGHGAVAQKSDDADKKARMETMLGIAQEMQVKQMVDGKAMELPLNPKALTHYNDPSRDFEDGTLWGFGTPDQRPQVLVTCYTKNAKQGRWIHAITSLSKQPLELKFDGDIVWNPKQSELKMAPIPDADQPLGSARLRMAQMRKLARRFKAHHFWDPNNSRFELRLLTGHVSRYTDKSRGVIDGTIFLFARNINPELCVLIEAVEKDGEKSWQFGVVKLGSAEFHVELDEKEVWKSGRAPGVVGRPTDPYAMFFSNRPVAAESN